MKKTNLFFNFLFLALTFTKINCESKDNNNQEDKSKISRLNNFLRIKDDTAKEAFFVGGGMVMASNITKTLFTPLKNVDLKSIPKLDKIVKKIPCMDTLKNINADNFNAFVTLLTGATLATRIK